MNQHVETTRKFFIKEQIKSKRTRKKTLYKKITNETRQKLIELVYLQDYLLKDAAKIVNVNYSTAKTILRIFRLEKRIEKKNADEEKELKMVLTTMKREQQQKLNSNDENLKTNELAHIEKSTEDSEVASQKGKNVNVSSSEPQPFEGPQMNTIMQQLLQAQIALRSCYLQINANQSLINNALNLMKMASNHN